jgi:hypothetical protein
MVGNIVLQKALTASDRQSLSVAIVEHLKRSGWSIRHGEAPPWRPETWYRPHYSNGPASLNCRERA